MYPIIALSLTGLLTLFLGFSPSKRILLPATLLFIFLAFVANLLEWNKPGVWFGEMHEVTNMTLAFSAIILLTGFLIVGLSQSFKDDAHSQPAEYFALMQFSLVGAMMMAGFGNLIMLFVGVEILSVAMYVLTGSDKQNIRGNEAALKYFLMGAFTTGILLFGIAMIYGAVGSFYLDDIKTLTMMQGDKPVHLYIGLTMLLIGLLFKVSAVPFHFWTPDVYDGAPTIFTAFMSTIVKTAGFATIYRILFISFGAEYDFWFKTVLIATILTLILSNITAVYQANFKRMMAFSSISHAGYLLLSIVGLSTKSDSSIAFYSLAYSVATVSAFGVLMLVSKQNLVDGRPDENISRFNGLGKTNPFLAVVLTISMLSLAGIPLTAGFWGKFFVFADAANHGFIWLLVLAVLMSAVGIYYYFKPILAVWTKENSDSGVIEISPVYKAILIFSTILTLVLGFAPDLVRGLM
jgi:NADH-quinone oxidoreductase subunit N